MYLPHAERMPRREFDYDEIEALSMSLPPGLDGSTSLPGTLERRKKGRGSSEEAEDGTDGGMPSKPLMRGTRLVALLIMTTITQSYSDKFLTILYLIHANKHTHTYNMHTLI